MCVIYLPVQKADEVILLSPLCKSMAWQTGLEEYSTFEIYIYNDFCVIFSLIFSDPLLKEQEELICKRKSLKPDCFRPAGTLFCGQ